MKAEGASVMFDELSDEALMLRYRDGEIAAFSELYRRHSRPLYRFIAWRCPRRDWADEIAQDAWINLHNARSRYEPKSSFRVYLYQIARNRLIDILRQHQLTLASDLANPEEGPDTFEYLMDKQQGSVSPEDALEAKQRASHLHAVINTLPPEQKEALVLQQFSGLSLEEIAHLSSVSAETVKSRLRYAMQKLRQHYSGDVAAREVGV